MRLLRCTDGDEWSRLLVRLGIGDIYFSPEYIALFEGPYAGTAECFVYEDEFSLVLYPYIKRQIGESGWSDVTSAYGFGGVLADPSSELSGFDTAFREYCRTAGIVSEFVRFHPLFPGSALAQCEGLRQFSTQPVVYVDFTSPGFVLEDLFRKEVNKKVRKAAANAVLVEADAEGAHLQAFTKLYTATMKRKQATPFYFFDRGVFDQIESLLRGERRAKLFVALIEGRVVGGLLVIYGDRFAYNFLSGSDPDHTRLGINDALQVAALSWAQDRGLEGFVLGGGVRGRDSLFQYKARFSPHTCTYATGARIHIPEAYEELCARRLEVGSNATSFFPLYRSPVDYAEEARV